MTKTRAKNIVEKLSKELGVDKMVFETENTGWGFYFMVSGFKGEKYYAFYFFKYRDEKPELTFASTQDDDLKSDVIKRLNKIKFPKEKMVLPALIVTAPKSQYVPHN